MPVSASGTRVQSACRLDHAPAMFVSCDGAAMKLRLMEQACGCTTVHDAVGDARCVLVSASGTRVQSACHLDGALAMCHAEEPP